jgi:hypothetical protein
MPCASVITWCLEPGRARPAGLGPVLGRPSSPARASRRSPPATSPARPRRSAQPAAIHAAAATHPRRASPADAASRSSRAEPQLLRQELPRNPVDSTNKIPDRTFRSSSRLRPGWSARRGTTGSTGSIRSHNPSGTIQAAAGPSPQACRATTPSPLSPQVILLGVLRTRPGINRRFRWPARAMPWRFVPRRLRFIFMRVLTGHPADQHEPACGRHVRRGGGAIGHAAIVYPPARTVGSARTCLEVQ